MYVCILFTSWYTALIGAQAAGFISLFGRVIAFNIAVWFWLLCGVSIVIYYGYMYVCMYACMHACMRVCMYVSVALYYVYVYCIYFTTNIHTSINTYTHSLTHSLTYTHGTTRYFCFPSLVFWKRTRPACKNVFATWGEWCRRDGINVVNGIIYVSRNSYYEYFVFLYSYCFICILYRNNFSFWNNPDFNFNEVR